MEAVEIAQAQLVAELGLDSTSYQNNIMTPEYVIGCQDFLSIE